MTDETDALRSAAERHLIAEEAILHHQVDDDQYVAVTDRRVLIVKVGSIMGERSQSIPLGAISTLGSTVKDGRVSTLQLSVPGRSMGEIGISGSDLSAVMRAIVLAMPIYGSTL